MPTPLRTGSTTEQGPETPEALLISALIEEGEFDLGRWRISRDDFDCYKALVRFCADHQEHTGKAPAAEVVLRKYPEFEITPRVDPSWAAAELRKAVASRGLRTRIGTAIELLNDDAVEDAYGTFEGLTPPLASRRHALDGFDHTSIAEEFASSRIEIPYPTLGRATGGIAEGELWYLAARTGVGKTNIASDYAATAVNQGCSVGIFSLEIPAKAWARRVRRVLARKHRREIPDLLKWLDGDDRDKTKEALDTLRELVPGTFGVFDPSHGRCTVEAVRDAMAIYDLVIVDHVGLMTTRTGQRAIDDWRVMATISNRLKEETLRSSIPMLGVVQINRQGDSNSPLRTPKISEIAQSDAIGQDGDVIVTMNRYSTSAVLHDGAKVRNGPGVKWFSNFDPKAADYSEIKRERANVLAEQDIDREAAAEV